MQAAALAVLVTATVWGQQLSRGRVCRVQAIALTVHLGKRRACLLWRGTAAAASSTTSRAESHAAQSSTAFTMSICTAGSCSSPAPRRQRAGRSPLLQTAAAHLNMSSHQVRMP